VRKVIPLVLELVQLLLHLVCGRGETGTPRLIEEPVVLQLGLLLTQIAQLHLSALHLLLHFEDLAFLGLAPLEEFFSPVVAEGADKATGAGRAGGTKRTARWEAAA
jgi:hypothetical protein